VAIIEMADLTKSFVVRRRAGGWRRHRREVRAVDRLSLGIEAGEFVGFIGPNGAGKSTTVKMLTGILVPTGGRLRVAGLDPASERRRLAGRMGVVFGQRTTLWWDLPLMESFDLLRRMYRVPAQRFAANLQRCSELLELGELLPVPVRELSLGQRMRGELTASLLHEPEVLYLDEPTIGLDVVSKVAVREFLAEVNRERGTTIVLTTHDLDDIERLCPRIVVVDHGRLVYDGPLADLRSRLGGERTMVVEFGGAVPQIQQAGVSATRLGGSRLALTLSGEANVAALTADLVGRGDVVDLTIGEPDIEEVVRRLYAAPDPAGPVST